MDDAVKSAQDTLALLQEALKAATNTEALLLMPLIEQAATLRIRVGAVAGAMEADTE